MKKGSPADLKNCALIAETEGDNETAERFRLAASRIEDAELALAHWDEGRESEYWLRHS